MVYSQSNRTHSDTPVVFHRNSRSVLKMQEKVEDVVDAIAAELAGSVRICESASFLRTFLPVPDATLESIFASVQTMGRYSATEQRWTEFPTEKGAKELSFYRPFVMAAEAIRSAVPGEKNDLQGQWHDRHANSPASSEASAKARPDCLFVSRPDAVMKLEAEVRALEQKVKQSPDQPLNEPNVDKEKLV